MVNHGWPHVWTILKTMVKPWYFGPGNGSPFPNGHKRPSSCCCCCCSSSWSSCLRNRLPVGGGCVYVLQMFFCLFWFLVFFCFFLFFSVRQKYETTVLENGWTDVHETFTKRYREKCSLKRRAAAWRKSWRRLANGECWWFA